MLNGKQCETGNNIPHQIVKWNPNQSFCRVEGQGAPQGAQAVV